jgi:hypothetical protein
MSLKKVFVLAGLVSADFAVAHDQNFYQQNLNQSNLNQYEAMELEEIRTINQYPEMSQNDELQVLSSPEKQDQYEQQSFLIDDEFLKEERLMYECLKTKKDNISIETSKLKKKLENFEVNLNDSITQRIQSSVIPFLEKMKSLNIKRKKYLLRSALEKNIKECFKNEEEKIFDEFSTFKKTIIETFKEEKNKISIMIETCNNTEHKAMYSELSDRYLSELKNFYHSYLDGEISLYSDFKLKLEVGLNQCLKNALKQSTIESFMGSKKQNVLTQSKSQCEDDQDDQDDENPYEVDESEIIEWNQEKIEKRLGDIQFISWNVDGPEATKVIKEAQCQLIENLYIKLAMFAPSSSYETKKKDALFLINSQKVPVILDLNDDFTFTVSASRHNIAHISLLNCGNNPHYSLEFFNKLFGNIGTLEETFDQCKGDTDFIDRVKEKTSDSLKNLIDKNVDAQKQIKFSEIELFGGNKISLKLTPNNLNIYAKDSNPVCLTKGLHMTLVRINPKAGLQLQKIFFYSPTSGDYSQFQEDLMFIEHEIRESFQLDAEKMCASLYFFTQERKEWPLLENIANKSYEQAELYRKHGLLFKATNVMHGITEKFLNLPNSMHYAKFISNDLKLKIHE